MTYIFLINKKLMTLDDVNNTTTQYLQTMVDGVNVKLLNINDFAQLYNLGYSTEYQDYYIKFT